MRSRSEEIALCSNGQTLGICGALALMTADWVGS